MQHLTHISSDQPVSVTIGQTDEHAAAVGRLLCACIRSGLFGQLSLSGQSVYTAILAESSWTRSGRLIASARVADLEALTALKTRAVQNALNELERFGLLERQSRGGGASTTLMVLAEPPSDPPAPARGVHRRAPVHAHAPVHPGAPVHRRAPLSRFARLGLSEPSGLTQNDVVDVVLSPDAEPDPDHAEKVVLLMAAGWSDHPDPRDVQRVAGLGTLEQVRSAIARARELDRRKTRRGSFRGCIVAELERGGYGLFADPKQAAAQDAAAARRLQDLCDAHRRTHRQIPQVFTLVFAGAEQAWNHLQMGRLLWTRLAAAGAITARDLERPDAELWRIVLTACEAQIRSRSC